MRIVGGRNKSRLRLTSLLPTDRRRQERTTMEPLALPVTSGVRPACRPYGSSLLQDVSYAPDGLRR